MEYNLVDVTMGNCRAVGQPRTERELVAVRHYRISATMVRKYAEEVNGSQRQFEAFISKHTKDGNQSNHESTKGGERNEDEKGNGKRNAKAKGGEEDGEGEVLKDYSQINIKDLKTKLRQAGIGHASFMKMGEAIAKAEEMGIL